MRRKLPGGLRWRLLLALVATSAVTLSAVALVVLPALQDRLRTQTAELVADSVEEMRPDFEDRYREESDGPTFSADFTDPGYALVRRIDSRVMVIGTYPGMPTFDTATSAASNEVTLAALAAMRTETTQQKINDDEVIVATPLFADTELVGALVVDRQLIDVAGLVAEVRDRFLIAALIGLSIAAALAFALSSTLLRRLGRLRAAARRISEEGPEATMPHDERRDEVGDLARALARMQDKLRRQESARRAFVSTASHELRTPLTMLQGTMELLEEDIRAGQIDELDALRHVGTARRELDRLSALAGELLDLSRLDAAVPLRAEPVELGELVRAVAAEFELRANVREAEIETILPTAPVWGMGDPDAVARAVRILLDNALRYAPPGGPITIAADTAQGLARVTVVDSGPGIPAAERERIFARFYRGSAASSSRGFGLGLAIGRELARRMGGDLAVLDGEGTRFALTLRASSNLALDH